MPKFNDIGLWLIDEARKRLNISLASVMIFDEKEKELVIIASIGLPEHILKKSTRHRIEEGIAGYVAQTQEPLLVKNIEQDLRFLRMRRSKTRYFTKSLISCPIKYNNVLFGILNVNNKIDKSDFTENDLKETISLANESAIRFSFANLMELKKKANELEHLLLFSKNIMLSLHISQIINYCQNTLLKLLKPEIIIFTIIPQKRIYLATKREIKETGLLKFLSQKISLFTPYPLDLSKFSIEITKLDIEPSKCPIKSLLSSSISLPIISENYEFGLLSIARENKFSREDLKFFAIILNYLTIAFDKSILYENLNCSLEKTREELISSERMAQVGKVTEKIAHDLRNPLSVALLSIGLAKKGTMDSKLLDLLNRAERASITMERLTEGLSSFAKEIKIKKENIDIVKVIEDSLFLLEDKFAGIEKKIDIAFSGLIPADSRRCEEVFTNIIHNAIQSMDGKGILGIKVEKDGDFLKIEISDTGTGIAPEIKDKIFDTFFTTKIKGLGLGLSIVKEIIEKHKGRIEVSSELNKGSCFKIFLPLS